jgi:hypothetical protein
MTPATRPQIPNEIIHMGMDTVQGFEAIQRCARLLSASPLVPEIYRGADGLPSCVIALNMATRLKADPLMVMQNLFIIKGKPGWSSKFLIATFNQCGRFSPIRYEFQGTEGKDDWGARATAVEKATGEKLVGPLVTIAIAKAEGWLQKNDSKWKTIPEQMMRYRSAAWFVNTVAPELAMGLPTSDEVEDFIEGETIPQKTSQGRPSAGMPTPVNDWGIEDLEALEDLLDQVYQVFKAGGLAGQYEPYAAKVKARRNQETPGVLLVEVRSDLAAMKGEPQDEPASMDSILEDGSK